MGNFRNDNQREPDGNEKESKRILAQVERESESVGRSSMVRSADSVRRHMLADDKDQDDQVEVWGTRIARILAAIAFVGLAIWLFNFLQRPR